MSRASIRTTRRARAASELTSVKLLYNDAVMPMDLKNVQAYFPRTTISLSPQGKVLKTDAPDVVLPMRLPGLDAKRFPDISYVPIEFPEAGIEVGKPWTFKKSLGGSEALYTVNPTKIDADHAYLDVKISQSYETFEDLHHNPVAQDKAPAYKIATTLSGSGTATFDRALGVITLFSGQTEADSVVTDMASTKTSPRKLKTTIQVKLKR